MTVLRPAEPVDAPAMAAVQVAARAAGPMPANIHPEHEIAGFLAQRLARDETWVAEVEGEVAAYARFTGTWLDDLYVDPAHQGEGIGTALLDLVLALRPTVSGYHQVDRALEEAAQVAGAGLFTRLRTIVFPLVAPAAMAGGLLIFMTTLSELTVSALLWSSGSETIGVVMFSFEQGGDSSYAAAMSAITVAITFVLMLVANLFASLLPNGVLPWRD